MISYKQFNILLLIFVLLIIFQSESDSNDNDDSSEYDDDDDDDDDDDNDNEEMTGINKGNNDDEDMEEGCGFAGRPFNPAAPLALFMVLIGCGALLISRRRN